MKQGRFSGIGMSRPRKQTRRAVFPGSDDGSGSVGTVRTVDRPALSGGWPKPLDMLAVIPVILVPSHHFEAESGHRFMPLPLIWGAGRDCRWLRSK